MADLTSGHIGGEGQAGIGRGNQQTNVSVEGRRYEELIDDIGEMKTDLKLVSREVTALVALRRDLDDLRSKLASVLDLDRDVERLKTWFFVGLLFLAATGWLYTNLTVNPLEDRIVVLERQMERILSWPYVTPTPP